MRRVIRSTGDMYWDGDDWSDDLQDAEIYQAPDDVPDELPSPKGGAILFYDGEKYTQEWGTDERVAAYTVEVAVEIELLG